MKFKAQFATVALSLAVMACGGGGGGVTVNNTNTNGTPNDGDNSSESDGNSEGDGGSTNIDGGDSSDESANISTAPGLELRVLDDSGIPSFGEVYFDQSTPPFVYDAHIRADQRNAAFTIGGLQWNGFVSLPEMGPHVFRLEIEVGDMRPGSSGTWSMHCLTLGQIGDVVLGSPDETRFYALTGGSNRTGSFQSPQFTVQSDLLEFDLTISCRRSGSANWELGPDVYNLISAQIHVLGPVDQTFQILPGSTYRRNSVLQ